MKAKSGIRLYWFFLTLKLPEIARIERTPLLPNVGNYYLNWSIRIKTVFDISFIEGLNVYMSRIETYANYEWTESYSSTELNVLYRACLCTRQIYNGWKQKETICFYYLAMKRKKIITVFNCTDCSKLLKDLKWWNAFQFALETVWYFTKLLAICKIRILYSPGSCTYDRSNW